MPVPAVGEVAPIVGRPGDQELDARADLVVAAGTAVRLGAPGHPAHQPVAVGVRLYGLDAPAYPLLVDQRLGIPMAKVATRTHRSKIAVTGSRGSRGRPCGLGTRR